MSVPPFKSLTLVSSPDSSVSVSMHIDTFLNFHFTPGKTHLVWASDLFIISKDSSIVHSFFSSPRLDRCLDDGLSYT